MWVVHPQVKAREGQPVSSSIPHHLIALKQSLSQNLGIHLSSPLHCNGQLVIGVSEGLSSILMHVQKLLLPTEPSLHSSYIYQICGIPNFLFEWKCLFLTVCLIMSHTIMALNVNCVYWLYKPG